MDKQRIAVAKMLTKVYFEDGYSNLVLNNTVKTNNFTSVQKGFITELFYGVIERTITLDKIISRYLTKPIKKLDNGVLIALRMGSYQLLFSDSVPASAAINESVNLAVYFKKTSAKGFVNAVLRKISKDAAKIKDEIPNSKDISFKFSCPSWLVDKLVAEKGKDFTEKFCKTSTGKTAIFVKSNDILPEDEFESTNIPNCYKIINTSSIANREEYKTGKINIQDMSSQVAAIIAGPQKGQTVIDACAAPGGKSIAMAMNMDQGSIISCDVSENKLKLLKSNAERMNIDLITTKVNDATVLNSELPEVDVVLCDVPCSGFGVIRRRPEIRFKNYQSFENLPEIQYNIINTSKEYVKLGGTLVYSTCTVFKNENEDVVNRFLENNKDFKLEKIKTSFLECDEGYHTFLPTDDTGDGFFVAKFRRY